MSSPYDSHLYMVGDSFGNATRRSSNRSIKRKKFDDEVIDYSACYATAVVSTVKTPTRIRTQSLSTTPPAEFPPAPVPITPPVVPTPAVVPAMPLGDPKRKSVSKNTPTLPKKNKKGGRVQSQVATKDLGRWKPTDDLALIIGVQQTNDLRTVHLGTKFTCKFTVQELQQRWYALLYDEAVSRVAVAAMRNLHPDMIAAVHDRALWSVHEEQLLGTITMGQSNPSLNTFADLLSQHSDIFYPGRTALALQRHWNTMRLYNLLPDQVPPPLPSLNKVVETFSDAEEQLQEADLNDPPDEALDRELHLQQRRSIREIRQLENELGCWNVLVDSVTGVCPGALDNHTLAVFRGRLVRYLMRSRDVTIGRSAKNHTVDIDLSLEGPAEKISRRHGTIRMRNTGEFFLAVEGKRPVFVDGRPITAGNKARLYDNSVVEFAALRFTFLVNQELIRVIHNESVLYNLPA